MFAVLYHNTANLYARFHARPRVKQQLDAILEDYAEVTDAALCEEYDGERLYTGAVQMMANLMALCMAKGLTAEDMLDGVKVVCERQDKVVPGFTHDLDEQTGRIVRMPPMDKWK